MSGTASRACPNCGAQEQNGNFCGRCGAALASPKRSRRWWPYVLAAAPALAGVMAAVALLGVGLVFGNEQAPQDRILDELGPPSRFAVAYMPRTEDGVQEVVRTEFWYYPDHRQRIAFVEGVIVSLEEIPGEPEDATYLDVSPQAFDLSMGYDEVVGALGEKAEKVDDIPELESSDGLEMYVTDHAMFAIERGKLTYIQTIGRTGSGEAVSDASATVEGEGGILYPVFIGDAWGYIDADGKVAVQPRYKAAEPMSEGLAVVLDSSDRYGYVDADGRLAIKPRFRTALSFHEGLAGAGDGERFGFIDTTGDWAIEPAYSYVGDFGDGLAPFTDGEKWGYLDRSGKIVIGPRFADAAPFSGGRAAVRESEKWGYIDKNGGWAIQPTLTSAGRFVDGMAPASTGDRSGYIDWKGNFVVEQRFLNAEPFSEGLAEVTTDEGAGFIDTSGDWVIEPSYEDAGPFLGGIAAVWVDGKIGYIDKKAEYIWQPGASR